MQPLDIVVRLLVTWLSPLTNQRRLSYGCRVSRPVSRQRIVREWLT